MRKNKVIQSMILAGSIASLGLSACSASTLGSISTQAAASSANDNAGNDTSASSQTQQSTPDTAPAASTNASTASNMNAPADVSPENSGIVQEDYDTDTNNASKISLSDSGISVDGSGASANGSNLLINKAGTYIISGTLTKGGIEIAVGENENVHLILNGANISNGSSSAIYMSSGKKLIVTLADNTSNTLSDAAGSTADAALLSEGSISINGKGTLTVNGNREDAIKAKNNLVIISGNIKLKAADNAIKGTDLVSIADGSIEIDAKGKGITSEGSVYIYDGDIRIQNSEEGLEGLTVELYGGNLNMNATDDGINARVKADDSLSEAEQSAFSDQYQSTSYFKLDGATVVLSADGDGLDSNGDVYIESGYLLINGPEAMDNGSLDYNGNAYISGGTFIGLGAGGMQQDFSYTSDTAGINLNYDTAVAAGSKVLVSDTSGKELLSFTADKSFSNLLLAGSVFKVGDTVQVNAGGNSQEVQVSESSGAGNGFGAPGGMMPPSGKGGDNGRMAPPDANGGTTDFYAQEGRPAPPAGGNINGERPAPPADGSTGMGGGRGQRGQMTPPNNNTTSDNAAASDSGSSASQGKQKGRGTDGTQSSDSAAQSGTGKRSRQAAPDANAGTAGGNTNGERPAPPADGSTGTGKTGRQKGQNSQSSGTNDGQSSATRR